MHALSTLARIIRLEPDRGFVGGGGKVANSFDGRLNPFVCDPCDIFVESICVVSNVRASGLVLGPASDGDSSSSNGWLTTFCAISTPRTGGEDDRLVVAHAGTSDALDADVVRERTEEPDWTERLDGEDDDARRSVSEVAPTTDCRRPVVDLHASSSSST